MPFRHTDPIEKNDTSIKFGFFSDLKGSLKKIEMAGNTKPMSTVNRFYYSYFRDKVGRALTVPLECQKTQYYAITKLF